MLEFVLGGAKTGKTVHLYNRIKALCQENDKVLYLVPEQFALEAEKQLFSFLGSELFKSVKVTNFTRLSHDIFSAYGEIAGTYANDCVKTVFMGRAVFEVIDDLSIYKKSAKYSSFFKSMLEIVSEFKNAAVTPKELEITAQKLKLHDEYLSKKLTEIALIYGTYDALVSTAYLDSSDDLTRACKQLLDDGYFKDTTIFIDEFKGFTKAQTQMLFKMLISAKTVCCALCLDKKMAESYGNSHFQSLLKTYNLLLRLARKASVSVAPNLILDTPYFENDALIYLEKSIFAPTYEPFKGDNNAIFAYSCKNEYDEVECVLATVCALVRHEDYTYNDIAIISRDINTYSSIFKTACEKYNVPFYDDSVDNVFHKPLFRFVNALLELVSSGITSEHILSLLKCSMTPFSVEEIAMLENYVYIWNIKGAQWRKPFSGHPKGFREELSKSDEATLKTVNAVREFVIDCVEKFEEECKNASGKKICEAIFHVLERIDAHEKNTQLIKEFYDKSDFSSAEDYKRVWEILMEILDSLSTALGDFPIKSTRFKEFFAQTAKEYDMGTLPSSLDTVIIGDAARIRVCDKKIIFIVGVNEGVFPQIPKHSGIFTDKERHTLCEMEIEISPPIIDKILEERFIAYKAMTLPLQRLYLTARRADISGEPIAVSPIFYQLKAMFSSDILKLDSEMPPEFFCVTKKSAFAILAQKFHEDSPFVSTLIRELSKDELYKSRIERLSFLQKDIDFSIDKKGNARELFGAEMHISPTRVEGFYRCAFRYFCEHGLRALPLKKAELNPLEAGTLIHQVLYTVLRKLDLKNGYSEAKVKELIKAELDRYIDEVMGGSDTKTKRFLYLYRRTQQSLLSLIIQLHEELSQSEFVPTDFEYEIKEGAEIEPIKLCANDDVTVFVAGKIDRIDSFIDKNGEKFIRIVDYKSGKKEFKLNDVLHGLNLQMLLYLHCITQTGKGKYGNSLPAGILYMKAGEIVQNLPRDADESMQKAAVHKAYRMNGLLLCEPKALFAMETPLDGIFIPVSTKNDGTFTATSAASLVTLSDLGKINSYIDSLIVRMANELQSGKIGALPLDDSCDYCGYSGVCGKGNASKKREYLKLSSNEEIIEAMKLESGDEKKGENDNAD